MPDTQGAGIPDGLVELGRVVSAYGVKGWVKIQPHSAQADVLLKVKDWWLRAPVPVLGNTGALPLPRAVKVSACRPQGATIVAQLDLAPDRDSAEALKGYTVWVPRNAFPPAADDEYYWIDLIGCHLFGDQDGRPVLIGEVVEVVDNGAHAILRVAGATLDEQNQLVPVLNAKGLPHEVLVPFVNAHIHVVDVAGKRIESDWPVEF
jgi:16S rRNA processing protein RimM